MIWSVVSRVWPKQPLVATPDVAVSGDLGSTHGIWLSYQEVAVMKLEIARGLFLVAALSVASLAVAAWQEPRPQVITLNDRGYCPLPPQARAAEQLKPDTDLLLFMFGLSQGTRAAS